MGLDESNAVAAAISLAEIAGQATVIAAQDSSRNAADATKSAAESQAGAERDVADKNKEAAEQVAVTNADANRYAADQQREAAFHVSDQELAWREKVADTEKGWHEQVAVTEADAQKDVAHTAANAQTQVATTDQSTRESVAQTEATAARDVADKNASASENVANTDRDARENVATTAAGAVTTAATTAAGADRDVASTRGQADRDVATTQAQATIQAATIDAGWHASVAQIEGSFRVQTAQTEGAWHVQVATIELTGAEYGADRQLDGVKAHETAETARLNAKLGFGQAIYNDIKPLIAQIVTGTTSFLNGTGLQLPGLDVNPAPAGRMGFSMGPVAATAGGAPDRIGFFSRRELGGEAPAVALGTLAAPQDGGQGGGGSTTGLISVGVPYINTRGVFTPAMLQQQVNQAYSRNDARTQTQIRKAQGDLAGRGFSSNSPILDILQVGYITANLRASIESASQIRLQAAGANVDAVFRSQNARSQQFIAQEGVLVDEERNQVTRQVGILQAVASLVGGIV